jgi:hypothetical protein
MSTDEVVSEEMTKMIRLRAQLAAVLDSSGVTPEGQAVAAIMTAARCIIRAQFPADVTFAMLTSYVIHGEPL